MLSKFSFDKGMKSIQKCLVLIIKIARVSIVMLHWVVCKY